MSATAEHGATQPALTDPFEIGGVPISNRVLLAPLAGIGNWFVRLQAKRHGAGLAVSEMVSSFALHYRNERTLRELMRIHPDEHPVSVQLFGHDAEVMRSGAAIAAEAGADLIDINMGCPVPKVRKTGAGAQLLRDPELALALARGAIAGGERAAGDGEAALRDRGRRPLRLRAGRASRRGGRRRRDRLPPARRDQGPQGQAGLRADPRAGRARRGAGDRLRRPLQRRRRPPRLRGVGRRRGDDRPRLARQPLAVRGTDRPAPGPARARRRSPRSCSG